MSNSNERLAEIDFVADSSDGLATIPRSSTAEHIIEELFARGMPAIGLIRRVSAHCASGRLMRRLAELVLASGNTEKQLDFLVAVYEAGEVFESLEHSDCASSIANSTFAALAFQKTHILDSSQNPYFEILSPLVSADVINAYWIEQVRYYLVQRNWRRAFDEWKRAFRGRLVSSPEPGYYPGHGYLSLNPPRYAHAASPETARGLLRELYTCMTDGGILPRITADDLVIDSDVQPIVRYTTRWSRRIPRKPHQSVIPVPVPGFKLAKNFLVQSAKGWQRAEDNFGRYSTPYIFTEEGVMVLKLSAYFNKKKNKSRRAEFERALASYNAALV